MKGKVGTSTSGVVHRRPSQRGNRRCKDCVYLKYGLSVVRGETYNYFCSATKKKEPKHYTTKCYCSHYKPMQRGA